MKKNNLDWLLLKVLYLFVFAYLFMGTSNLFFAAVGFLLLFIAILYQSLLERDEEIEILESINKSLKNLNKHL